MFYFILTGPSQVRFYSKNEKSHLDATTTLTSHQDTMKVPSFDEYRWDHRKDPTSRANNEKQMTYHYLVTAGLYMRITQIMRCNIE